MTLNVYVPNQGGAPSWIIAAGSGIVGTDYGDTITIDYEGNLYGAVNMVTWADRIYHAAGRHLQRYPTVARVRLPPMELIQVGEMDMTTGVVTLDPKTRHYAERWVGVEDIEAELSTTTIVTKQPGRDNARCRASKPKNPSSLREVFMSKTIAELEDELGAVTIAVIEATQAEQRVAAHLLARLALEAYPTVKYVGLGDSDQGDWLWTEVVVLTDGTVIDQDDDDFDQNYGAASHLYNAHLSSVPGLSDWNPANFDGHYTLDIQTVLDELDD